MSRQKFVTLYSNGIENDFLGYKAREILSHENTFLNLSDLNRIETALRLRVEACEENDEKVGAGIWRGTLFKVQRTIENVKNGFKDSGKEEKHSKDE
jgi:hypothetical protein